MSQKVTEVGAKPDHLHAREGVNVTSGEPVQVAGTLAGLGKRFWNPTIFTVYRRAGGPQGS